MGNPPLKTAEAPAPRTHTLSVTHELAVADGRGAQLVRCTITPKAPAGQAPTNRDVFQVVAKVYDPLYYSFPHTDLPSVPCDVTWLADEDYSREAAAYEHLQNIVQAGSFALGTLAPGLLPPLSRSSAGNAAQHSSTARLDLL